MKPKVAGMIVIDGMDGSGKDTQCARLQQALNTAGLPNLLTREPGGSVGAEVASAAIRVPTAPNARMKQIATRSRRLSARTRILSRCAS